LRFIKSINHKGHKGDYTKGRKVKVEFMIDPMPTTEDTPLQGGIYRKADVQYCSKDFINLHPENGTQQFIPGLYSEFLKKN
jgi:hypothetical protein